MVPKVSIAATAGGKRSTVRCANLRPVQLRQKTALYQAGDLIKSVYFPVSAVVSLVVTLTTGETTEAAMVGNDGAIGMASALDGKIALSEAIVQLGGEAIICEPDAFRDAVLQSENLLATVMRHEQALFAQAEQSTACMANHEVEARLCRCLLRARDLSGSDDLPFTQEFLGDMLGVRRTSVTTVAHTLQGAGIVQYSRGKIRIVDVERLKESACECYETLKEQQRNVVPSQAL